MSDDNTRILLCMRVKDRDEGPPALSTVDRCGSCGAAVWVANTSPPCDQIMCFACAALLVPKNTKIEQPTEEQLRELKDLL